MREALKLTLAALKQIDEAMPFPVAKLAIMEAEKALAQPEQRSVSEHLEPVECDCNQGQSCHVCDPYFPFDSAPQTTRLTQKTTTNDVAIGVDVTEDGTHVTAMRMRPDGINIVIYSQFHPLAQPEQEPVAWLHTKIEGVAVPHRPADLDKHPDRWEALYKTPSPCPTCEALARTVMLDQTSYDTTPPQRTWVGLTHYELQDFHTQWVLEGKFEKLIDAVEAKLKEKNT